MSPLDHPHPGRPHRIYAALTNHCNRACPWCSTWSSPAGACWITLERLAPNLPDEGCFDVQLEGGEPTLHPDFWRIVGWLRQQPRCRKLILCTNGAVLPRDASRLHAWLARLGAPLLVKLSINHHLLEHDAGLLRLARTLGEVLRRLGGEREVVYNVRLRRGYADDDRAVGAAVAAAGLGQHANVFFLQRYGMAGREAAWDEPFLAGQDFRLVNPDGRDFGTDLLARSEAMGRLP